MTRDAREPRAAYAIAAMILAGCASEPLTEIVVAVDSDLSVPTEIDAVELEILSLDPPAPPLGPFTTYVDPVQRFHVDLPVTLGLSHRRVNDIEVVARALRRTRTVAEQRARVSYRMGEVLLLCLRVDASCAAVECPADATCRAGTCEPIDVDPESLPDYVPDAPVDCSPATP